ncbi:MAG: 3-deoxy-7-phosphoheptulonate synthase [Chloroflexi bacterium]|nr:MAG: 3-deoxy-7-phosphoheptulonate synthase [Chloroflexota bacterium]
MAVRGIRGATTTDEDSEAAIVDATTELLAQLARENALRAGDIAAVWFTTTPDLTAEFPAAAARRFGWGDVPLLCGHEMAVPVSNPRSLPRCIRVLLLVNTDRPSSAMRFMIIVMRHDATPAQVAAVVSQVELHGCRTHLSDGDERTVIGVIGTNPFALRELFIEAPGVAEVVPITKPFKLSNREFRARDTRIRVGAHEVGGDRPWIVAGPCSVDGEELYLETCRKVRAAGAHALRGGVFKPRTSPYSFQGLRGDGINILREAKRETGLPLVCEVLETADIGTLADIVDVLQIGARNMQNFPLLSEVGRLRKPVLLKRGMSATIEEWLLSAEYILSQGNYEVILCERGIRTFETYTRNTLDLNAVPLIKELSHLPVIVDPSHGTGRRSLVTSMALAGIAAGAHGLMVEVHAQPEVALSDGAQSLTPQAFAHLVEQVDAVAAALSRTVGVA